MGKLNWWILQGFPRSKLKLKSGIEFFGSCM
jgi:hypothetical protein